jgi:hypothetical protein
MHGSEIADSAEQSDRRLKVMAASSYLFPSLPGAEFEMCHSPFAPLGVADDNVAENDLFL